MTTALHSHLDLEPRAPGRIKVPHSALRYILYQRTDYLALPRRPLLYRALRRLTRRRPLDAAIAMESTWRGGAVRRAFNRDMALEYAEILPYLPAHARTILDVGCGVGGIDVLLHRHYGRAKLYLVDRTQTNDTVYYAFREHSAFYNSLEVTRGLLVRNRIPEADLHFREVGDEPRLNVPEAIDLVISLISWGFHYPVSTYIHQVHALLRPGSRVILDVRKGTDGKAQLEARFPRVTTISDAPKKERVVAEL